MTGRQQRCGHAGPAPAGIGSEHTGFSNRSAPQWPGSIQLSHEGSMPERRRRPETAQTGDRIASRVPRRNRSGKVVFRAGLDRWAAGRAADARGDRCRGRDARRRPRPGRMPGAAAPRQSDARGAGDQSRHGRVQAGIRAGRACRVAGDDNAGLQPERCAGDNAHGCAAPHRERPRGWRAASG